MRIVRQIGLLLVAVCALSALTVSSASAGQPLFLSHPTSKLLASAGGAQTLTTPVGNVVCEALSLTQGSTTALKSATVLVTVQYSSCLALGAFSATIHPIQYLIGANGLVRLENTVQILVPAAACTITIPASENQSLNTVKFDNNTANKGLLLLANVTKIHASGVGGCEFSTAEGTDTGTIHVVPEGTGTLKWEPNA